MATLFIDFENGNDNYAGTSFALLAQGTDGAIVTATFTSVTASFPNDGSLIGQYLSIFNGTIYAVYNITAWVSATSLTIAAISGGTALANQAARQYYIGGRWKNITTGATAVRTIPGDTIRIMGSPAPTSLGQNGVWTSQSLQATKAVTASTNATPIAITCTAHGYSTGDTVVIVGAGVNIAPSVGTWEITVTGVNTFTLDGTTAPGVAFSGSGPTARLRNNSRVKLTTAVTQNIASTGPRTAWTNAAGANGTATLSSAFFKEHQYADRLQANTAFTTGKLAYYTLPATLDLSGYQQVSFYIYSGSIALSSNQIELRLCSDSTGDTVVNTISVPAVPLGRWMAVTIDNGASLGSSISSISYNINSDLSTTQDVPIFLSNIIACKASSSADSLTLTSLIGKNTTGETFWGIQSINGTRVMLDADTGATPTSTNVRGYYGTSATVTTWKRETIKLGPAVGSATALQTIQESGTDSSFITYSGGWDRTNMSTQTLETWLDGVNGNGYGIFVSSLTFIIISNLAIVRCNNGLQASNSTPASTSAGNEYNFIALNNCTSNGANVNNYGVQFNCTYACADGIGVTLGGNVPHTVVVGVANSCGTYGLAFTSQRGSRITVSANNNGSGIFWGSAATDVLLQNCSMSNNGTYSLDSSSSGSLYFYKTGFFDGLEMLLSTNQAPFVFSQEHDQTANNHKIFSNAGLITSAVDQRKTPSGISWKMQPTSTTFALASRPLSLSLAKVACSANNLVTIKAWMYRNNSGLTMRLVCKGGQIAGVASDVVSALTTTNAWEEETITFTPTETGVVDITAEAWGGTTFSGWVDDMTISQA